MFRERLKSGFAVTVEMEPPKSATVERELKEARKLKDLADGLNLNDSPMARMRMSPIALASIIKSEVGLDPIIHITCRDRNRLAIQAELLGAWALGVQNVLALRGDSPEVGDHPEARGVFDLAPAEVLRMVRGMNQGKDHAGNALEAPTSFFIGAAMNFADGEKGAERMREKIECGADFFQSQIIYDARVVEEFISEHEPERPVLVGTTPFRSLKLLEFFDRHLPGVHIPDRIKARLKSAKDVRAESRHIAVEFADEIKSSASGLHIMPVGDIDLAGDIIREIRGK